MPKFKQKVPILIQVIWKKIKRFKSSRSDVNFVILIAYLIHQKISRILDIDIFLYIMLIHL